MVNCSSVSTSMPLPPKKWRSRRLRKKLHLGAFKEHGFDFDVALKRELSHESEDLLMDRLLTGLIEPRHLALGGKLTGGFVSACGRGSATEEDQSAIEKWLRSNLEIEALSVGPLKDAWYLDN